MRVNARRTIAMVVRFPGMRDADSLRLEDGSERKL